jgi:hypothetical protein
MAARLPPGRSPSTWPACGTTGWAGWWWADPAAGLAITALAAREGLEAWQDDDLCRFAETRVDSCSETARCHDVPGARVAYAWLSRENPKPTA